QNLNAPNALVFTREHATETVLKAMSLDRYQVIHFATHGLLAGDTQKLAGGLSEGGLILTPPTGSPTEHDDGLLTASEVAQLKLNAEWVVLSACSTAGSGD